MKRILSAILIVTIVLGSFSSCIVSAEEGYMIKGEFFSLIMKEMNYYPIDKTWEDVENETGYDIEAQTMVDWGIFDKTIAFSGLLSPVDKETVILACIRSINFIKTGKIEDVKDAKLCKYPQEMADAVVTGLVETDAHGYLNAKEKMSYSECEKYIEKAQTIEADGHFDEEMTVGYDFEEETHQLTSQDIAQDELFNVKGYDEVLEALDGENDKSPIVTPMSYTGEKTELRDVGNKSLEFTVSMSKSTFEKLGNPKKGEVLVFDGAKDVKVNSVSKGNIIVPCIGRFVSAVSTFDLQMREMMIVTLTREGLSDEEVMEHTDINGSTEPKDESIEKTLIQVNAAGFKFEIKKVQGGIKVEGKKTLDVAKKQYGNWRDAQKNIDLTFSATIKNFRCDSKDVKYVFKKESSDIDRSLLKFTYDFEKEISLSASGKFVPDSNRNASFFKSFLNSRFTNGNSGSKAIKIAKVKVPLGETGLFVVIYFLLHIDIDGNISIYTSQENGFELVKRNGHTQFNKIKNVKEKKVHLETKITVGFEAEISLKFALISSNLIVIGASIEAIGLASMDIYYKNNRQNTDGNSCQTNKAEDMCDADEEFGYEANGKIDIDLVLKMKPENDIAPCKKNLIYSCLGKKIGEKMQLRATIFTTTWHVERNVALKKAERDQDEEAKRDKEFKLPQYYVTTTNGSYVQIELSGIPVSSKVLNRDYKAGIQVEVKNKKMGEAWYEKETGRIVFAPSSSCTDAEILIYLKKNKKEGKKYIQHLDVHNNIIKESSVDFSSGLYADTRQTLYSI